MISQNHTPIRTHLKGAELMPDTGLMKDALEAIRDYPGKGGRRTEDGYPGEIVYDEFAYRRMVNSYRAAAEAGLRDQ